MIQNILFFTKFPRSGCVRSPSKNPGSATVIACQRIDRIGLEGKVPGTLCVLRVSYMSRMPMFLLQHSQKGLHYLSYMSAMWLTFISCLSRNLIWKNSICIFPGYFAMYLFRMYRISANVLLCNMFSVILYSLWKWHFTVYQSKYSIIACLR